MYNKYKLSTYYNAQMEIKMRILLVEDDENLNQNLTFFLKKEGYQVDSCFNGEDALYYVEKQIHDIILLDRMLPLLSGTEVLKAIRKKGNSTPILLITALGTLSDRVEGLDLGADDYLVKPFELEELSARIRSLARRIGQNITPSQSLHFQDLSFHAQTNELTGPGGTITLSKREGALMEFFIHNPEQILSRAQLINKVWGIDGEVEDGNLDNYIFFLRRRLKVLNTTAEISTIRGIGYRLENGGTYVS